MAVAIRPIFERLGGIWFGWSGKVTSRSSISVKTIEHGRQSYVLADLSEEDFQEYYNGFANRVLWPILHYRPDVAEFSYRNLSGYMRVNERFASELHKLLLPDDLVWIHDYHLIPLAQALRRLAHGNRIGFFCHVPFPPPEILTALPNHEDLIATMRHYDLIGFQTEGDATNFARYLSNEGGAPSHGVRASCGAGRTTRTGIFPVGVETAEFARLAQHTAGSAFVRNVMTSMAGRTMIIGVDRMDYSKGIALRMEAFGRFLSANADWLRMVTYLQISPRTRSTITEYAAIERQIGEIVGSINGKYGDASWTPIRYVNRAHSRSVLAGLYRSARVALVTPLRDGMNLVAKEYVAAQDPADPGVLVLSQFAGAAAECRTALLVNPFDSEAVGLAIGRALAMPLDERRSRHAAMFEVLRTHDVKSWGESFLSALTRPESAQVLRRREQRETVHSEPSSGPPRAGAFYCSPPCP